ncbi:MAG TPA: VOC family protein, partial [Thermoleophilaceae bacterium]|nr:VOC family protein [Thermoleophilaceae bacterium]
PEGNLVITRLSHTTVYVLDQAEALTFYRDKLGFEVRTDQTMDNGFRWLTVGPKGQPDLEIVLMEAKEGPMWSRETAEQVRGLMAKGFAGTIFLTTDDCHAAYEELKGRGVEFVEEPEKRPYGIDSSFRDPSGNHLRLTQVRETAAV